MNKWLVRMIGILLLLMVALVFVQMHRTLLRLQRQQMVAPR